MSLSFRSLTCKVGRNPCFLAAGIAGGDGSDGVPPLLPLAYAFGVSLPMASRWRLSSTLPTPKSTVVTPPQAGPCLAEEEAALAWAPLKVRFSWAQPLQVASRAWVPCYLTLAPTQGPDVETYRKWTA